jgi:hypothetical protein
MTEYHTQILAPSRIPSTTESIVIEGKGEVQLGEKDLKMPPRAESPS